MTRRTRSPAHREAICIAHKWECHICHGRIDPVRDQYALDHMVPLMGGGSDDDANLAPVHNRCHAVKTKDDVCRIAKGKRVRAKHL
jgi:5-methylcytosine-specific restriction enzyme A